jgi:hypothetical protein
MQRQIEAERAKVPSAGGEGRMHGARGGAPKGQPKRTQTWGLRRRGARPRRQISALARMARETMGAIE